MSEAPSEASAPFANEDSVAIVLPGSGMPGMRHDPSISLFRRLIERELSEMELR